MESGAPPRPVSRAAALVVGGACASMLLVAAWAAPAVAASKPVRHAPPPVVATGQPAPTSMDSATAVACGDTKHCWAVGFGTGTTAAIAATNDGGVSWQAQPVPTGVAVLAGVSCFDRLHCMAVGSTGTAGAVLVTTNGGRTWNTGQVPSGAAAVTDVGCTAKVHCLVLATDGMTVWSATTTDGGTTWGRGGNLPPGMTATGLACTATALCVADGYALTGPGRGGGVIATTANGGATWGAATLPTGVGVLRGVTCAGQTCLAAGSASAATTGFVPAAGQVLQSANGGQTWTLSGTAMPYNDAFGASCPDPKTCLVVGTNWVGKTQPVPTGGIASTLDGGVVWRPAVLRYVPVSMAAVACPIVNSCFAVGGNVLVHVSLPVTPPVPKTTVHRGQRAGSPR